MVKDSPERSCLGCRRTAPKQELLRFVLAPDRSVVPDPQAKLPGRGAYTCCRKSCLLDAIKRNQFSRSFKGPVTVAAGPALVQVLAGIFEERVASYIALANKAGKVVSGSDMVEDAVRKRSVGIVMVAADASDDIAQKILRLAQRSQIPAYKVLTRDRIGALTGKGLRTAVAVHAGGFVAALRNEIERFRNFSEEGEQE